LTCENARPWLLSIVVASLRRQRIVVRERIPVLLSSECRTYRTVRRARGDINAGRVREDERLTSCTVGSPGVGACRDAAWGRSRVPIDPGRSVLPASAGRNYD
jgi:hypothetical protein